MDCSGRSDPGFALGQFEADAPTRLAAELPRVPVFRPVLPGHETPEGTCAAPRCTRLSLVRLRPRLATRRVHPPVLHWRVGVPSLLRPLITKAAVAEP